MNFPERFSDLPPYAFPRLRMLLDGRVPGGDDLTMTIGEPQHAFPAWIKDALVGSLAGFNKYPPNQGSDDLLSAISGWLDRRYGVTVDPVQHLLTLNGTREGLYNSMMALCPEVSTRGHVSNVLIPNPFYQVYLVATLSVGANPVFLNATQETGFLPDYRSLDADTLNDTAVAYICSPSNPQGAVADEAYWTDLLELAEQYDFKIFADECYSEIWRDAPPPGVLEIAKKVGADPERVVAFHSLSKRSNMPGLRSGFVCSGPKNIAALNSLRNYAGTPLPLPLQAVAAKVWADEDHVVENRNLYQQKYKVADQIMGDVPGYQSPAAGFFLWLPVKDGEASTIKLWEETGVKVLPGAYLSQDTDRGNPGKEYIRVAMVTPTQDMQRGLTQLRDCIYG